MKCEYTQSVSKSIKNNGATTSDEEVEEIIEEVSDMLYNNLRLKVGING